jgi:hypothetical protein
MPYGQVVADSMQTSSGSILGAGNATAFKNRLIDAGFIINQRGYTSGTSLASGSYGHDRWKGGGSGGTYTFTQGSAGVPISITITAGSIQQVIEGCNMPEGGTYVLSWTGTAQARFNGGTYGSSPLAVTGITAGANTTIEFNTGTCSYPQLEVGSTATSFDYRPFTTELQLCQRYFERSYDLGAATASFGSGFRGVVTSPNDVVEAPGWSWAVSKRAAPTIVLYNAVSGASGSAYQSGTAANVTASTAYPGQTGVGLISLPGQTASNGYFISFTASAEL